VPPDDALAVPLPPVEEELPPPVPPGDVPPVLALVPAGHRQASKPVPLALQTWAPCPPPTHAHATVAPGMQALPPSGLPAGVPEQAVTRVAASAAADRTLSIGVSSKVPGRGVSSTLTFQLYA
jgi:hypothetical protein